MGSRCYFPLKTPPPSPPPLPKKENHVPKPTQYVLDESIGLWVHIVTPCVAVANKLNLTIFVLTNMQIQQNNFYIDMM